MCDYEDENDENDEVYDRYMITGEGAEFFGETPQGAGDTEIHNCPQSFEEYLDDLNVSLDKEIMELERMLKAQKHNTAKK